MSNTKTVAITISQESGFNFTRELTTVGVINNERLIKAFVNQLYKFIAYKKARKAKGFGGSILTSLKLNQPFFLNVSGAMTLVLGYKETTSIELPIKHSSKLFKDAEKLAKQRMVEDLIFVLDQVGTLTLEDAK